MPLILTQTDTVADDGFNVGCSGGSAAATTADREATEGGTAGVTAFTISINVSSTEAALAFQSNRTPAPIEPGVVTWQSGNYVVRINVTTSNMNVDWEDTYVCERTSGAVFNTVASLTAQNINCAAVGVKSMTINRATDYTAAADSTLYFVLLFENQKTMGGAADLGITPDQNIDTPIELAPAAGPPVGTLAMMGVGR